MIDKLQRCEATKAIKSIKVKKIRELGEAAIANHYKKWYEPHLRLRPVLPFKSTPQIKTQQQLPYFQYFEIAFVASQRCSLSIIFARL